MKNNITYKKIQNEITNHDGETALVYGIEVSTQQSAATLFDISCYNEEIESCIRYLMKEQIEPSQLFNAVENFTSKNIGTQI